MKSTGVGEKRTTCGIFLLRFSLGDEMNGFLLPVVAGEEDEVLLRLLHFMEFLCAEWLVETLE